MTQTTPVPPGATVVVHEKRTSVHVIYGFITLVLLAALLRGHFGAETDGGRLTGDIVFGVLTAGVLAFWIWSARHPARLEVSSEQIKLLTRGGSAKGITIDRSMGDLYIARRLMGKAYVVYLKATGTDDVAISLQTFDQHEVQMACVAAGWRFASAGA